jgi:hypothetical protein
MPYAVDVLIWPFVWLVTSAMLVAAGVQYGPGWLLPLVYIGLNAAGVAIELLGEHRLRDRFMTVFGWAAALQLPVFIWSLRLNRRPSGYFEQTAEAEAEMRTAAQQRQDRRE